MEYDLSVLINDTVCMAFRLTNVSELLTGDYYGFCVYCVVYSRFVISKNFGYQRVHENFDK